MTCRVSHDLFAALIPVSLKSSSFRCVFAIAFPVHINPFALHLPPAVTAFFFYFRKTCSFAIPCIIDPLPAVLAFSQQHLSSMLSFFLLPSYSSAIYLRFFTTLLMTKQQQWIHANATLTGHMHRHCKPILRVRYARYGHDKALLCRAGTFSHWCNAL
ncbi:uncharacterized protein FOMMEDRAFT_158248 [Fomitiporia mediterranea MF3/22]|uniref:uncharacterized protein n=1 Tax=Fomitiporia mediterranea (strain MF3/22) TaxID=694068 RepID=UPI0004408224|nr:uncharacterized protein FOMMEDRAFT_158248 [Fomitiporia mediterranea MF3/22]EJD01113.1 hypothetical protein FOMMEDRAFT_158248 [Fomitiporia mediterranea MF3/22]